MNRYNKIRIYIDSKVKRPFAAEVSWTWRLVLTSIGYNWEESHSINNNIEIAYVTDLQKCKNAKICIKANLNRWREKRNLNIINISDYNTLPHTQYHIEQPHTTDIQEKKTKIILENDIIFDIFYYVTGQIEQNYSKDKHGFFNISDDIIREKLLQCAPVSRIIAWIDQILQKKLSFQPIQRWPNHKKAAACFSHDVDYPEVKRLIEPFRVIKRLGKSGLSAAIDMMRGNRTHCHFKSWIQEEKKFGVRSAFYFVPIKGSLIKYMFGIPNPFYDIRSTKFKELFSYLTNEGFEIGLHASYLAYMDEKQFRFEKKKLEDASGQEISGNRHHYWHLNPKDPESTLNIHEKIGLKYDTSLTHERYIGWRRGISYPFFPFHQEKKREIKTLQIQTAWMDDQVFGYAKVNKGDPRATLRSLTNTAAEQGGCLLINIHDYVFDEVLYPGWSKTYFWLMEHILDHSDFWIATPGEIADYWVKRYRSILDSSDGLREGL